MNLLGILQNAIGGIGNTVENAWHSLTNPYTTTVKFNTPTQYVPTQSVKQITPTPTIQPQQVLAAHIQTNTPSPVQQGYAPQAMAAAPQQYDLPTLTKLIQAGFQRYGNPPAATAAASFAKAGMGLPDPFMPAVLSLKETSGGKNLAPNSLNNYLNLGPNINYPSIDTMLNGGGNWGENGTPQKGFTGIMHSGNYNDYLKSGNLTDFFKKYTPTYNQQGQQVNGTPEEQVAQYQRLRNYFSE